MQFVTRQRRLKLWLPWRYLARASCLTPPRIPTSWGPYWALVRGGAARHAYVCVTALPLHANAPLHALL